MPFLENGLVIGHNRVGQDIYELEFITPKIASKCQPGQFVHIRPSTDYYPLLRRPLSLYDVDKRIGSITLLYKVVGKGTHLLSRVRTKDYIDVMGPLGKSFTLPGSHKNTLLIGGGVGIAPLVYLARVLKEEEKCNVKVLHGSETQKQLVILDKLRQIGVEFMPATVDGSAGFRGLVTELLYKKINPADIDFMYACGPEPMLEAVAAFAHKHGIPGEVSLEEHMACGVGACLGCARRLNAEDEDYAKVCKDGPVFSFDEVKLYKKS